MATANGRDVPLTLSVKTLGTDGVKDLQSQVKQLAKEGALAAPAFDALNEEISRLGAQSELVQATRDIAREVDALSEAQDKAAATSRDLRGELATLAERTEQLALAERAAKTELLDSQRALFDKRQALAVLKNETSAAEKETSGYTVKVTDLTAAIIKGKTEVRDLGDAYRVAKTESSAAAAEEAKMQRAVSRSAADLSAAQKALSERNRELQASKSALAASALATEDVADAERKLMQVYGETVGEIDRLREANAQLAESERRLAIDAQAAAADYVNFWQRALKERDDSFAESEARRVAAQEQAAQRTARALQLQGVEERRLADARAARNREFEAQSAAAVQATVAREAAKRAALQASEQAAKDAADALGTAFRTVGTKSVEELRAEIVKVNNALALIKSSGTLVGGELDAAFAAGERRVKSLEREIRAATGQVTLMDRASAGLKSTLGQVAAGFGIAEVLQRLGAGFLSANTQLERLRLGLASIYKSSATASVQIDFLRKSANDAGVSMGAIADSFVKFAASTSSANIPIEQTNALFAAITRSAGTLGLSGDKVNHMLDALAQMAGKGVVSMEELRQQLGDSLPGALSLTAKGLGLTDAELIKLVESGGLLARDLFPALTKSLQGMAGEINTLQARWERFKNALAQVAQTAGDAGWLDVLKGGLTALTAVLYAVVVPLSLFTELVFGVAKAIGILIGAVATLSNPLEDLSQLFTDANNRLTSLNNAFLGASDAAKSSGTAIGQAAQQSGAAVTQSSQQASAALGGMATAHGSAAGAAVQNAGAQTQAASAAAQGGTAAAVAGQSWQRLSIDLKTASDAAEKVIVNAEKLARAKELEGQAAVTLAELTGSESRALEAQAFAALGSAGALAQVTAARTAEVAKLTEYKALLEAEALRLGDQDGARGKFIASVQQTIDARQAELEKALQQEEAAKREADARTVAVETYKDNSAALDDLRRAHELTADTLAQVTEMVRAGWLEQGRATAASQNAAKAEALYRDALRDSASAVERNTTALRNKANTAQAALQLDLARSRSSEALAKAMGNETLVIQEQINQKEIEARMVRAAADAKTAEANAIIAVTQQQIENLRSLGELTAEKEAELNARLENAKAMQLEAGASRESINLIDEEIKALRRLREERQRGNGGTGGGTGGGNTGGRGGAPGGTQPVPATRAPDKYGSPLGSDKYGSPINGKSTYGNTREERLAGQGAVDNTAMFALRDKLRNGTLTGQDLPQLEAVIAAMQANQAVDRTLTAGAFDLSGKNDAAMWANVLTQFTQQASRLKNGGGSTYNVSIGGRRHTVKTASDADSSAMNNLLSDLETASKRAA